MGDISAQGGLTILSAAGRSLALPHISIFGSAGLQVSDSIGVALAFDASFAFAAGVLTTLSLMPALRIGSHHHVDVCLGPAFIILPGYSGLAGTLSAQGHISLVGPLALSPQLAMTFDASGVIVRFGVGLGASF